MSDFEVCPIGTLQRLAQVEAERDSMKEILDHIPQVEAELAETSDKLHAMTVERDALLEALDKIACFAPGYGEACEIIAKVARSAIAQTKGGGNG